MKLRTAFGEVLVEGRFSRTERPVLFTVGGLFQSAQYGRWLVDALPEADVVLVRLPGMGTPSLVRNDMETTGAAHAQVIAALWPDRRVVPFGMSAGSLAAMALCGAAPGRFQRLVLMDPFLQPGKIWSLKALMRAMLTKPDDPRRDLIDEMLGLYSDPKDFRGLLRHLPNPTDVLVGGIPLGEPRNDAASFPSVSSDEERALWAADPRVRLHVCEGAGHNVLEEAREATLEVLRAAVTS